MTKLSPTCCSFLGLENDKNESDMLFSFLGLENDKTESDMLFFSGVRE